MSYPLSTGARQISKKLLLFLLSERQEATFRGKHLPEGDQQFPLNIFAFVILWSSVKVYQIIKKVPYFQKSVRLQ